MLFSKNRFTFTLEIIASFVYFKVVKEKNIARF